MIEPAHLLERIGTPTHRFADTLDFIEQHYHYRPSGFHNGPLYNSAAENQGSCRILAMALDLGLSDDQALACFAEHYQAVLADPEGGGHANIRALMQHGLAAVRFDQPPLKRR